MMTEHFRPTRLSYAHEAPDLRSGNPLYERTGSLRAVFDQQRTGAEDERAERRESFMVKRQQPKPVLRPSRTLALGSEGAAFDAQWDAECQQARPVTTNRSR